MLLDLLMQQNFEHFFSFSVSLSMYFGCSNEQSLDEMILLTFHNEGFSYHSEVGTGGLLNLGKKVFEPSKLGKLILDPHFE